MRKQSCRMSLFIGAYDSIGHHVCIGSRHGLWPRLRPSPSCVACTRLGVHICSLTMATAGWALVAGFLLQAGLLLICSPDVVRGQDKCLLQISTGTWQTTGMRPVWQDNSQEDCQISDGINTAMAHNYSVLLLGDSLEREQIRDICAYAQERGLLAQFESRLLPEVNPSKEEHLAYDSLLTCRLPTGYIQLAGFMTGAWPSGPYWLSHAHSDTPPQVRIKQARILFEQQWGAQPDILIFNINFWDAHRFEYNGFGITNQLVLRDWKENFNNLLGLINEQFPKTRLKFYHTSITRVPNELLPQPVIADLNTAGTGLAYSAGWQVVDLTSLVAHFQESDSYLRDHHHPKPFILLALFDMYMSSAARLIPKPHSHLTV